MSLPRPLGVALLASAATLAGCDGGASDRSAFELDQARQAVYQRDQRIRMLEWQASTEPQRTKALLEQHMAREAELLGQLNALRAERASLVDRLGEADRKLAALPPGKPGATQGRATLQELRTVKQQALEGCDRRIADELGRLQKLIEERHAPAGGTKPALAGDPAGFGDRK